MIERCVLLFGLAACGPVGVADDASSRLSEGAFGSLADAVGGRLDGTVGASGEAMLGDDGVPHRWARVDPDQPGRARGAYVLSTGDRVWLVTYETDGRTEPWTGDAFSQAIVHAQGHHHGSETIGFALRGGVPVVLEYELIEEDSPEDSVSRRCQKACSSLRGFDTQDARFVVTGPAATVDELINPAR